MGRPAVRVEVVGKAFRDNAVLRGLSFEIDEGVTFAIVGRNGAGKTTTIRLLTGMLAPDHSAVSVLGLDPRRHADELRRKIGYLAEDQTMYRWMRVRQLIRFVAAFYPTWDDSLASDLLERFELATSAKVGVLSKGQRVRLGLLIALAHRPPLVILDDPVLGLDPVMRKTLNRDIITHLQGEGRTVVYSSHLLHEIEAVADVVAILDGGRMRRVASTETLREDVKRIIIPAHATPQLPPARLDAQELGDEVAVTVEHAGAFIASLRDRAVPHRVVDLNLDEIFEAYVAGDGVTRSAEPATEPEHPDAFAEDAG